MKKISILLIAFCTYYNVNATISNEYSVLAEDSVNVEHSDSILEHSLPYPCTGKMSIVEHFGEKEVPNLQDTKVNNKGVVLNTEKESTVHSVHNGIVSAVFVFADKYTIIVRHGEYLSVYSGMEQVSVKKGQKVTELQPLGNMGANQYLNFQWRKGTKALNPEDWFQNDSYSNNF